MSPTHGAAGDFLGINNRPAVFKWLGPLVPGGCVEFGRSVLVSPVVCILAGIIMLKH